MKLNIFNPNSVLSKTINYCFDIFALSICWLICTVPIFTTGLSCTGLYYAIDRYVTKGEVNPIKGFVRSIRINLKQGIIIYLIVFFFGLLIIWSMWISYQMMIGGVLMGRVIFTFGIIIAIYYLGLVSYVFPTLATYKYSNSELLSVCFKLSVIHLPYTIVFSLMLIVGAVIIYYFWIFLCFLPGLIALVQNKILIKIYDKHS